MLGPSHTGWAPSDDLCHRCRLPEDALADPIDALILDLLEWIGPRPRAYAEVLDAWRTSCPRLPVWEDANDRGFVEGRQHEGRGILISVTALGWEFLQTHRPDRAARASG
jgi:hypothetical protein